MTHLRYQYVTTIGIGLAAAILLGGMNASGAAQTANRLTGEISAASGQVVPVHSEVRALIERYSADERSLDRYFVIPFSSAHDSRFASFYQEWGEDYKKSLIET